MHDSGPRSGRTGQKLRSTRYPKVAVSPAIVPRRPNGQEIGRNTVKRNDAAFRPRNAKRHSDWSAVRQSETTLKVEARGFELSAVTSRNDNTIKRGCRTLPCG